QGVDPPASREPDSPHLLQALPAEVAETERALRGIHGVLVILRGEQVLDGAIGPHPRANDVLRAVETEGGAEHRGPAGLQTSEALPERAFAVRDVLHDVE